MRVLTDLGQIAAELRRTALLANPRRLCEALNLLDGSKRQAGDGVIIRCPSHGERNPSCSVTRGPDGTVRCRCFSCDWTGDALTLIGVATGRTAFAELVDDACDMVGMPRPSETEAREWVAPRPEPPREPVSEPRGYPGDANRFWGDCRPVTDNQAISALLQQRCIDVGEVSRRELARAIVAGQSLPWWASRKIVDDESGESWVETWLVSGHVLVLPVYDCAGEMQSVRAWRVVPGDGPKRLPPGGHKATGLILANNRAIAVLRGETGPCRVVLTEGEPDYLVWATSTDDAVFGVLSGAWTAEHAKRIPLGSTVMVRTHCDKAGDKYAAHITETLRGRGQIRRLVAA